MSFHFENMNQQRHEAEVLPPSLTLDAYFWL